ncbi:hypothetical protein AYI68_g4236 [Smittium mucronatum]|uniref:Uncharacterized protein n=1 Tax=Smittium mucronatum TaxID=133383 RepID=A0A1R0GXN2_9FUNG|nr:hypothetical protein AYI68_g4236 [Smittium mucronatum]
MPDILGTDDPKSVAFGFLSVFRTASLISSSRLTNIIMDISTQPEVFKKLLYEQREIVLKYGSNLSLSAIDNMHYLDAVILESLRLSNPAGL